MANDSARLGDYVAARRRELGLTRAQVQQAGGPSVSRLATIEENSGPDPSAPTLQKLDAGLQWQPGSAARTLSGGIPRALPDAPTYASNGDGNASDHTSGQSLIGVSQVSVAVEELAGLLRAVNRLTDSYAAGSDDLGESVRQVQSSTSSLAGRWATEVLERNRISNTEVPAVLELAFGHLLDAPTDGTAEPELTERLYRRWLSGRVAGLTEEQTEAFTQRLHRRANHTG
ncbi:MULTISPECIES: helix-turn-helix domain-containing protein [Rhodococcus]|uniref:helix-turn-helix domain-containing protein n=1 Tax=Rhodococcus TaxID=1827 RepID=UPI001F34CAE2|nr:MULTISPECIES: helix-turn-helix domain-containing protein [Rhodococcus]MCF8786133.1 helix-turn-helix domain-containing protein [Rhodococcus ruber]UTM40287.1 helix-turn-helix domain-containing protein [Rhodococcus pyridinivorans]WAL49734.1 helix-turn-helix domain-containing protein [Rhodococcus pyridinivorans]